MDLSEAKNLTTDYAPAELDLTSQILLRAANIVETRGHCKGAAQIGEAFCLSGAISTASIDMFYEGSKWALYNGHESAMRRIEKVLDCAIMWNDAPERTAAEVVAKLRAVALSGSD